ncbi:MAG: hypothetical protein HY886_00335 [Deltaproteobacteria bacterium]|nr:hypothetical protein [Deltaproteobacteria bacterium]
MVKDAELLKKFEERLARQQGPLPREKAVAIFAGMWDEAVAIGVLPSKTPMDGIETDIKLAQILNSCLKKSSQG